MRDFVYHCGVLGLPADILGDPAVQTVPAPPATAPARTPPVEARRPLIKDHQVSLAWIQNLNAPDLQLLLAAIKRAEQVGFRWREEWVETFDASVVISELIPAFFNKHGEDATPTA